MPALRANLVQEWRKTNFEHFWPKTWWPLSSLDIIPLDFSRQGMVESEANSTSNRSKDDLIKAIEAAWAKFPRTPL